MSQQYPGSQPGPYNSNDNFPTVPAGQYGTNPAPGYGQPAQPTPPAPGGYSPMQSGYGQPGASYQPMGYGADYLGGAPYGVPPKRSSRLAVIGAILIAVAWVILTWSVYSIYSQVIELASQTSGGLSGVASGNVDPNEFQQIMLDNMDVFSGASLLILLAILMGTAGWIVSLIAVIKRSLRPLSITMLIAGPVLAFVLLNVAAYFAVSSSL